MARSQHDNQQDNQHGQDDETSTSSAGAARTPGSLNRAFTAGTLAVGFAIVVVMLFATLAPGPRPFLRNRLEVLGSTESTIAAAPVTVPPQTSEPGSAIGDIAPNDDWTGPLFGVEDTTFGDDAVLDALHRACTDEHFQACDDLVALTSETRSPYELWGLTCGDRSDLVTSTCAKRFGTDPSDTDPSDTDPVVAGPVDADSGNSEGLGNDLTVGSCLALPRSPEGSMRAIACDQPHDAQLIAQFATNNPLKALDGSFYVGPEVLDSMQGVCAAAANRLVSDAMWEFPQNLLPGIVAPTEDDPTPLFGCFLWAPGWALEAPVVTTR